MGIYYRNSDETIITTISTLETRKLRHRSTRRSLQFNREVTDNFAQTVLGVYVCNHTCWFVNVKPVLFSLMVINSVSIFDESHCAVHHMRINAELSRYEMVLHTIHGNFFNRVLYFFHALFIL